MTQPSPLPFRCHKTRTALEQKEGSQDRSALFIFYEVHCHMNKVPPSTLRWHVMCPRENTWSWHPSPCCELRTRWPLSLLPRTLHRNAHTSTTPTKNPAWQSSQNVNYRNSSQLQKRSANLCLALKQIWSNQPHFPSASCRAQSGVLLEQNSDDLNMEMIPQTHLRFCMTLIGSNDHRHSQSQNMLSSFWPYSQQPQMPPPRIPASSHFANAFRWHVQHAGSFIFSEQTCGICQVFHRTQGSVGSPLLGPSTMTGSLRRDTWSPFLSRLDNQVPHTQICLSCDTANVWRPFQCHATFVPFHVHE